MNEVLLESTFEIPPNQDNLPSDDGIPMETQRHKLQMDLLVDPLTTWLSGQDAYVGDNMFVYLGLAEKVFKQKGRGKKV